MLSSFLLVERDEENARSIEESQGDSLDGDYRNLRPSDEFTKLFTRLVRRYILDISRSV